MNVVLALVVGVLFGVGVFLMLKRDLIRNAVGISMISNSIILFIVSVAAPRGVAPIHPLEPGLEVSDPLGQALALTAVVINFGVTVLVLSLVYRIFDTHQTLDQESLQKAEASEVTQAEKIKDLE